jgi:8-oxo-dGTP diphosphatase
MIGFEKPMPRSDQGVLKERYQIIPRTLIFITREDKVLLIKGAPSKRLWANRYNGIGGHIERGEDVLSAARRELQEETGLHINDLDLCGTILVDTGEAAGIGIFVMKGEYRVGNIHESSEGKLEWVRSDQIEKLPVVEDLVSLFPRVFSFRKGDTPFSARYFYDEADHLQIRYAD